MVKLPQDAKETSILNHDTRDLDPLSLKLNVHEQYLERLYQQYNIKVDHALLFYVEEDQEPVIFVDKAEINVGRRDDNGRIIPEFDLSAYDGAESGVSRLHAKIVWDGEQYLIQDLHSTNHTWLNSHKLIPYQYSPIPDGAIIQFGRLAMTAFVIKR
ncbi:MAG: FHA domain-containing protein [Anaerolineae bacterium]